MNKTKKGFTLIELLVVIAVISLLSSIILVSLSTARSKGSNTSIKTNLATIRNQAGLIFSGSGSFATICNDSIVLLASSTSFKEGGGPVTCANNATTWSVVAKLKISEGGKNYYCVDHQGNAILTASTSAVTSATCTP